MVATVTPTPNEFGQTVTSMAQGLTAQELASSLASKGIEVTNAKFTGNTLAAGIFSGFGDAVGIGSGVVLSSGTVGDDETASASSIILGPNESAGTSHRMQSEGDADLDKIVDPDKTIDAAVLEFDFVPSGTGIEFNYVFGSDEYNEFVNEYNDVFSLYVNGKNCALVPGAKDAVSINNVNNDKNSKYYRDNEDGKLETELDGLTTKLACNAKVNPGEVNHIKLAIADTADFSLDSAVLVEAGSIKVNNAPTASNRAFTTIESQAVDTTLKGTDADGDSLTYAVETKPAHGKISGSGKSLTYTPEKGFVGEDTFTYVVSDGAFTSEVATVTITVEKNTPPVGKVDTYKTNYMAKLTVKGDGVLDNDSDVDGQKLSAKKVTDPAHGTLSFDADGTFAYTPEYNFSGTDTFTYTVSDGIATSEPITVTIKVGPKPPALADTGASSDSAALLIGGLGALAAGAYLIRRRTQA